MAELNLNQIIDRLNAEFSGDTRKLVYLMNNVLYRERYDVLSDHVAAGLNAICCRPPGRVRGRQVYVPVCGQGNLVRENNCQK